MLLLCVSLVVRAPLRVDMGGRGAASAVPAALVVVPMAALPLRPPLLMRGMRRMLRVVWIVLVVLVPNWEGVGRGHGRG